MSRVRLKTLFNAVWAMMDTEFESSHSESMSLVDTAQEMALRNCIIATLENPALKGKRLVQEVERLVQELVRLKRQHAQRVAEPESSHGGAQ